MWGCLIDCAISASIRYHTRTEFRSGFCVTSDEGILSRKVWYYGQCDITDHVIIRTVWFYRQHYFLDVVILHRAIYNNDTIKDVIFLFKWFFRRLEKNWIFSSRHLTTDRCWLVVDWLLIVIYEDCSQFVYCVSVNTGTLQRGDNFLVFFRTSITLDSWVDVCWQ